MPTATRFTTRYLAYEDRIQLALELPEEEIQVLWLTRRLLNRMVPHLIKILDQSGSATAASADTAPSAGKGPAKPQKEALQRFNQEAAVSAIERQPGVGAGGERPADNISYLVTSVDVNTGPKSLSIDFKAGDEVLHRLPFGENALRQWLNILHSQYRTAGWNEAFWPSWIASDAPAEPARDDLLLN